MYVVFFVCDRLVTAMFRHDIIRFNSRVWTVDGSVLVIWPRELARPDGPHRWEGIGNPLPAIIMLDHLAAMEVFSSGILPPTARSWMDEAFGVFIVWALE